MDCHSKAAVGLLFLGKAATSLAVSSGDTPLGQAAPVSQPSSLRSAVCYRSFDWRRRRTKRGWGDFPRSAGILGDGACFESWFPLGWPSSSSWYVT